MADPADLLATDALTLIGRGALSAAAVREACIARAVAREPTLHAMAAFDPATIRADGEGTGRLAGLPVGVKDVLDTAGLPTEYGSPIWRGHRPRADAAAVAWACDAGAALFGKTVTTEFATRAPGPTTNPHDPARTPGGSSSGSAAAVAAGFVPFAFGTQTAGSIIRPAAYCGVVGFKPSFGTIDRAGMKVMSASLDTIGSLARSVSDAALLVAAASGLPLEATVPAPGVLRIGLCRSPQWGRHGPETETLWDRVAGQLGRAGVQLVDAELPEAFASVEAAHRVVMQAESARAMGWELRTVRDGLSETLRENLLWGLAQPFAALQSARATLQEARARFAAWASAFDAVLTPSAPGEAPLGLDWTGDPAFNLLWTALHVPCVTVPAGLGPSGMPLGIQVVGRFGEDAACIAVASAIERVLGVRTAVA